MDPGRIVGGRASNQNKAVVSKAARVEATGRNNQVAVSKTETAITQTGNRVQTEILTSNREIKTQVTNPGIKNNEALKLTSGFPSGVFYFC